MKLLGNTGFRDYTGPKESSGEKETAEDKHSCFLNLQLFVEKIIFEQILFMIINVFEKAGL